VAGIGDVNGDNKADFAVGAAAENSNGTDSGTAYVISGTDAGLLYFVTEHARRSAAAASVDR
jgi:hypothetical protein